jgi:hypothetical protein
MAAETEFQEYVAPIAASTAELVAVVDAMKGSRRRRESLTK